MGSGQAAVMPRRSARALLPSDCRTAPSELIPSSLIRRSVAGGLPSPEVPVLLLWVCSLGSLKDVTLLLAALSFAYETLTARGDCRDDPPLT